MSLKWFDPHFNDQPFVGQALHMTPRYVPEALMLGSLQALDGMATWKPRTYVRNDQFTITKPLMSCNKHQVEIFETFFDAPGAWSKVPFLTFALSRLPPIGLDIGVRQRNPSHWDVTNLDMAHLSRTMERVSSYLGIRSEDFRWKEGPA
jgi:hypothetical protein